MGMGTIVIVSVICTLVLVLVVFFCFRRLFEHIGKMLNYMGQMPDRIDGSVKSSVDQISSRVENAVNTHLNKLDNLSAPFFDRLDATKAILENIGKEYEKILDSLNTTTDGFCAILNTVQDFDGLRSWTEALGTASQPLQGIASGLAQFQDENRVLVGETANLLKEWAQQHQRVEDLYKDAAGNLTEWQIEHSITMREDSEALRNQLQHIAENYEITRRTLGKLEEAIEQDSKVREELRNSLPLTIAQLGELAKLLHEQHRQQIEAISSLNNVAQPMIEAAQSVRTQASDIFQKLIEQIDKQGTVQVQVNQTLEVSIQQLKDSVKESNQGMRKNIESFGQSLIKSLPDRLVGYLQIALLGVVVLLLIVTLIK